MPDNAAVAAGAGIGVATDEILSALTGTVAKTASSATVTGTSTLFTTELSVGMVISVPGTATERGIVTAIANDTSLTVAAVFANSASGQTASRVAHFQRMKLIIGADGVNDGDVSKSNPLPVGGNTTAITPTITVSTSPAYSSGDSISGKITLTSALAAAGRNVFLSTIHIMDRANQKPTGYLLIFNADPTAATITDNAAFVYSTDDLKQIGIVPITAADYVTINGKASAWIRGINGILVPASGTTLYAVFVTNSTPTFAATTDLQIVPGFVRD